MATLNVPSHNPQKPYVQMRERMENSRYHKPHFMLHLNFVLFHVLIS